MSPKIKHRSSSLLNNVFKVFKYIFIYVVFRLLFKNLLEQKHNNNERKPDFNIQD